MNLIKPTTITKFNPSILFSKWSGNYLLPLLFFIVGGSIALFYYRKIGYTHFYQNFVPEAILWACGYEYLFPKNTITELIPFIKGKVLSFDCKTLPSLDLYSSTSEFAGVQPYLTRSIGLLWKLFGVNYQALCPLVFALWGAYTSGIFLLFRQFCQKWIAALATLFICISPVMIHMIGNLRDFSKAPFIIWALLLLIYTIKQPLKEGFKIYIPPILAGGIAGLGMGFRSDLYFLLPIGSVFLMIGFCNPQIKTVTGQIVSRGKICILFAATFIILASPILKNGGPGGVGGVFIMQGMSEPFRKNLMLDLGSYNTGWAYSDELTLSSIAASERQKDPEKWDKRELSGTPGISISQAMYLGTTNLLQWADLFIGDFTNQAIKSFTWIVGFPLYIANSNYTLHNPFLGVTPQFVTYSIYKKLGGWIFLALPLIGFILILFDSYLKSKSESIAFAFLFLFLGAYSAIQFDFRHFFYLEFLWILCFIFSISSYQLIWKNKIQFFKFLLRIIFLMLISVVVYFSVLEYQKYALSAELQTLLSRQKETIAMEKNYSKEGNIVLSVPIPIEFSELVKSEVDSMTPAMEFIGSQWDVRSAAARYLLTISGLGCNKGDVEISFNYKHSNNTWQPLDHKYTSNDNSSSFDKSILFSGFYRPTQYFENISIPANLTNCIFKLEKISTKSRLPYAFISEISNQDNGIDKIKGMGKYNK